MNPLGKCLLQKKEKRRLSADLGAGAFTCVSGVLIKPMITKISLNLTKLPNLSQSFPQLFPL